MFKSSFAKYLTAFVLIILVSFLLLAGIITSMIRAFMNDDLEEKLELTGSIVVDMIEDKNIVSIDGYIDEIAMVVMPIVNFDTHFDVLITTPDGKTVLSTMGVGEDGQKAPLINLNEGLGTVDLNVFQRHDHGDGETRYVHRGTLSGLLSEQSLVYAKPIVTGGLTRGYVITLSSTVKEDKLVGLTKRAVINSSVWVMLAAVIAAYFITERIIHPMRAMTSAAKKFGKGDFSIRVPVNGKDEVSELGKAFNNMAESLDNLEKMRNSFLANISHDLRTPMTTIAGFIDGINSGAIPPEKHEYYLGVISAEVHRLSRLVSQLLDVSRLESGERKFNYTDFDIAEMARIILISFEKKIDEKRLDVEFEAQHDEMIAHADKDAIYQVLYNLCHNAIKFAREEGKFRISISNAADGKIRVSVYDEGQSIPKEDAKMVFERFYKTDKSRGLDKSGVGLGLYISKTIIDAHGETIGVESDDNSCEFFFTVKDGVAPQKLRQIKN